LGSIEHAREILNAAAHNISGGFYGSGVIAAFRQRFVKPGLIEAEYGDIYGRIMDDRHVSDYDVESSINPDRAQTDLDDARRFVDRSVRYLNERGLL
jgi:uncharacterized protein (UPF0332 family)